MGSTSIQRFNEIYLLFVDMMEIQKLLKNRYIINFYKSITSYVKKCINMGLFSHIGLDIRDTYINSN